MTKPPDDSTQQRRVWLGLAQLFRFAEQAVPGAGRYTGPLASVCQHAADRIGAGFPPESVAWDVLDALGQLESEPTKRSKRPPPPPDPPWLTAALGELGEKEVPGSGDNPRVREYHGATAAGEAPDSVPWCASFVNWCLQQAGHRGTRRKNARSFLDWGRPIDEPRRGAVVVFRRGAPPSGHVAFVLEGSDTRVRVVGGNQSNSVNSKWYPKADVLGYRWPEGAS